MTIQIGVFGGPGGHQQKAYIPEQRWIKALLLHSGDVVDAIGLKWTNDTVEMVAGEKGRQEPNYTMESALLRNIRTISGTVGDYEWAFVVKQIQFTFTDGTQTGLFGQQRGSRDFLIDVPQGYYLSGFWGWTGNVIDSLGFIFDETPRGAG